MLLVKHGKRWAAMCACSCGGTAGPTLFKHLRSGHSFSCGCAQREAVKETGETSRHGGARRAGRSPTYRAWQAMRGRCRSRDQHKRQYYLDRGVTVCERWDTFENFRADMGEPPAGFTLDRIDPDKGYSPENCRWATWVEQRSNQRRNYSDASKARLTR